MDNLSPFEPMYEEENNLNSLVNIENFNELEDKIQMSIVEMNNFFKLANIETDLE